MLASPRMTTKHPWGPGVTLDPDGPTRDVKVCLTPTDEIHIETIRKRRNAPTRSAAIREALASYATHLGNGARRKKKRQLA